MSGIDTTLMKLKQFKLWMQGFVDKIPAKNKQELWSGFSFLDSITISLWASNFKTEPLADFILE